MSEREREGGKWVRVKRGRKVKSKTEDSKEQREREESAREMPEVQLDDKRNGC